MYITAGVRLQNYKYIWNAHCTHYCKTKCSVRGSTTHSISNTHVAIIVQIYIEFCVRMVNSYNYRKLATAVYGRCSNQRLSRKSLSAVEGVLQYNTEDKLRLEGLAAFWLTGRGALLSKPPKPLAGNWVKLELTFMPATGAHTHIGGKRSGKILYGNIEWKHLICSQHGNNGAAPANLHGELDRNGNLLEINLNMTDRVTTRRDPRNPGGFENEILGFFGICF